MTCLCRCALASLSRQHLRSPYLHLPPQAEDGLDAAGEGEQFVSADELTPSASSNDELTPRRSLSLTDAPAVTAEALGLLLVAAPALALEPAAPETPSPPKSKAAVAEQVPEEKELGSQDGCLGFSLLDPRVASPPPPTDWPYTLAVLDVVRQSHVLAGAVCGVVCGLAYSLKLSRRRYG